MKTTTFTPKKPGSFGTEGEEATLQPGINFCPNASKIGTVKITTPLLPNPLEGARVSRRAGTRTRSGRWSRCISSPKTRCRACSSSSPGEVSLNPSDTGQIVATFEEHTRSSPFEDAELHFFGGERAPLATPAHCGTYTTAGVVHAVVGQPAGEPRLGSTSSTFRHHVGPERQPVSGASLPFSPSLTGGTTNINAGAFSRSR